MKTTESVDWIQKHTTSEGSASGVIGKGDESDAALLSNRVDQDYVNTVVEGKRVDTRKYSRWFTRVLERHPTKQVLQTVYCTGEGSYVVYERTIQHGLSMVETAWRLLNGTLQNQENKSGSTRVFRGSLTVILASGAVAPAFPPAIIMTFLTAIFPLIAISVERKGRTETEVRESSVMCFEDKNKLKDFFANGNLDGLPNQLQPELYR